MARTGTAHHPTLTGKRSVRNLFYEPAAPPGAAATLNEELRCTLEKIYQEVDPHLCPAFAATKWRKLAFNMRLARRRQDGSPSVPLLAPSGWISVPF